MKRFTIIANPRKDKDLGMTLKVIEYLEKKGCCCFLINHSESQNIQKSIASTECILVVGGDGSIIRTVRRYSDLRLPFVGINMGRVGYLVEIEPERLYQALDALIMDQVRYESRMMLEGSFNGTEESSPAVNDIVISRGRSTNLIRYAIYVNGEKLYTYNGDGVIISTPTGSTGYSLAAGGPIISPKAEMILITPVCAMTLNSRSVVLSAEDEVMIEFSEEQPNSEPEADVSFDGQLKRSMLPGDRLVVKKSMETYDMIRIRKESFLDKLRKKMSD